MVVGEAGKRIEMGEARDVKCETCAKAFRYVGNRRKFCSQSCYFQAVYKRRRAKLEAIPEDETLPSLFFRVQRIQELRDYLGDEHVVRTLGEAARKESIRRRKAVTAAAPR